jgi:hypothetical protein
VFTVPLICEFKHCRIRGPLDALSCNIVKAADARLEKISQILRSCWTMPLVKLLELPLCVPWCLGSWLIVILVGIVRCGVLIILEI